MSRCVSSYWHIFTDMRMQRVLLEAICFLLDKLLTHQSIENKMAVWLRIWRAHTHAHGLTSARAPTQIVVVHPRVLLPCWTIVFPTQEVTSMTPTKRPTHDLQSNSGLVLPVGWWSSHDGNLSKWFQNEREKRKTRTAMPFKSNSLVLSHQNNPPNWF